ncbi:glycosyl transferase [Pseudomonas fluorescens WH6]|nr:glycosyl transferase [Pseudomonas fluorescens WH6]
MVLVEVDNKLPMYLQNHGKPFYYVAQSQDFPRQGDTAALMAWLEKTSGQRFDSQRTIIVAPFSKDDPTPLAYLAADHQVIVTQPDNGERLFHKREEGSVAFIPASRR